MSTSLPSPEPLPRFRVAICGAGIAGLVLAITIGKYNPSIPIDLYEAHDCIDTVGAGISLWRQTHEVMTELGLFDDFKEILTRTPDSDSGPIIRRADIPEGGYVWYQRIRSNGPSVMHRQQMVSILEKHLPQSCTVHPKKRLVDYVETEEQNPILLNFADGSNAMADILVGADGIRSAVRKTMFEKAFLDDSDDGTDLRQYINPTFTGMSVYRCIVPAETLRQEDPQNISLTEMLGFVGKGKYIVTYPIAKGTLVNVVAIICNPSLTGTHYEGHWVADVTCDEMVACLDDFEPNIRTVIKLCQKPSKWALHVVKPLPFCVRKKVVLIGDACHAMTPHLGAGGGQAIDDGFVLGRLIAHPQTTLSRMSDILCTYEKVRLPFVQEIARMSLSTGWMQSFMEPGFYDGTRKTDDPEGKGVGAYEREGMEILKQEILKRWDLIDQSNGGLETWADVESGLRV